jgi:hypothetical protein
VNALKKVTQFEVVPLPEVLAKARLLEEAEPADETVAAPPEPAKLPKKSQNGLPEK